MILAAQEQAVRTNSIKYSIDKTSVTPLCSLCGDATETVRHIVSGCKKLAHRELRKLHDKGGPAGTLGDVPEILDRVY